MTELSDLVGAYKRETALLGTYDETFPKSTDVEVVGALADAFAEAQLDGFFHGVALDLDDGSLTPDLSTAGAGLVVLYAGARVVRQQIVQMNSRMRVKAGSVEYETERATLTQIQKDLTDRKKQLIENALRGIGTSVFVFDSYRSRMAAGNFYGGFLVYEAPLTNWYR